MTTKVFSSRADEAGLAFADAVTREQFGMSFGKSPVRRLSARGYADPFREVVEVGL